MSAFRISCFPQLILLRPLVFRVGRGLGNWGARGVGRARGAGGGRRLRSSGVGRAGGGRRYQSRAAAVSAGGASLGWKALAWDSTPPLVFRVLAHSDLVAFLVFACVWYGTVLVSRTILYVGYGRIG